jgi:PadR family transcriptional regulator
MNDLVILAALLRAPAYGYALTKTAGLIFGNRTMQANVVYPLLKRFVQNGWVGQSSAPGERGQTRKQYKITAAGRKHLFEQLSNFTEDDASYDGAFLFRIAFFDVLPRRKRAEILAARKSFLASRAAQLAQLSQDTKPDSFAGIALNRVQALVGDELRWLRKLERQTDFTKGDLTCKPTHTAPATARQS